MLLAIDIGNTHTVVGVFDGETLVADWRMASMTVRTRDESWLTIKNFCADARIPVSALSSAGISSVVPDLTDVFEEMVEKYLRTGPVTINASLDLGIRVHYADPLTVGPDRLCNAVAGYRKYGGPLIIIDLGTATTFDVIAANGDYLGGVIMLGMESAAAELHRRTARLPKIELHFPAGVIGHDTTTSMQAGVMFGTIDALEGMIRRIASELGQQPRVIATGGLSAAVASHSTMIDACEPSLVLEGIRLIVNRVKGKP